MTASRPGTTRTSDTLALAVLCAAQFVLIVDVVVVNVALPSVRAELGLPDAQLSLAAVAYTVTFGSLLIAAGRAGDAWGRRRLFVAGTAVFTLASLLTGLALEPWQFFAARAAQGVGAAMVSPNALALLLSRFADTSARNRVMGVWGSVGAGGAIAGQALGGVVVETLGWRWIFLINVPLGAMAVVVAMRVLHASRGDVRAVDPAGSLLLVGSLAPAVITLALLPDRGVDALVAVLGSSAAAGFWLFLRQQRGHAAALVPPRLLRAGGVSTANLVIAVSAATVTASLFFTTLYLQVVLEYSALVVGLAFAPITLIIMALAPVSGRLVSRHGARYPLVAGLATSAAGMFLLSRMSVAGSYWTDVLPPLLLIALGSALTYVPGYIAATAEVSSEDEGAAAGLLNTSQEIGPAVGLAVIAAVASAMAAGSTSTADLVAGYHGGLLVASAATAVILPSAMRIPRDLGRVRPGGLGRRDRELSPRGR